MEKTVVLRNKCILSVALEYRSKPVMRVVLSNSKLKEMMVLKSDKHVSKGIF